MKQYSIRQHVAWLTMVPLLLMAVSLELFFLHDRFSALDAELVERGQLISHQLASDSEYGVFSGNRVFLQEIADGALRQPDVRGVMILDADSGILVSAGRFIGHTDKAGQAPNITGKVPPKKDAWIQEMSSLKQPVYFSPQGLRFYQPIVPERIALDETEEIFQSPQIGSVILEMSNERTGRQKWNLFWMTAGSTLLFMIFPVSLIYLTSRNIISPIRQLSTAIRALGDGRLETRVPAITHVTELDTLARGINDMAAKLQQESEILHQRMEDAIRIAAIAFESHEGMMIVNPASMIMRVNKAFTRITGYTEEEAVGQNPRLLASGHHDDSFYAAMWESINSTGMWQGEIWNRRKTGEIYPAWVNITTVKREDGEAAYYVATYTDITTRKAAENEIKNMAFYDVLTQLPNRRMLLDRMNQTMASSKRSGKFGAVMFIDLDNFKPLNDRYGHEVGDLLLIEVARRLVSCVREVDTVARFGGDEFVVMLSELDIDRAESMKQAGVVAEKIRVILAEPYSLAIRKSGRTITSIEHQCTSSIGVQLFAGHEADAEDVFKQADLAMYRSKRAGRNQVRFGDEAGGERH